MTESFEDEFKRKQTTKYFQKNLEWSTLSEVFFWGGPLMIHFKIFHCGLLSAVRDFGGVTGEFPTSPHRFLLILHSKTTFLWNTQRLTRDNCAQSCLLISVIWMIRLLFYDKFISNFEKFQKCTLLLLQSRRPTICHVQRLIF